MGHLIAFFLRLIVSKSLQLLMIIAVLIAGSWLIDAASEMVSSEGELARLESELPGLEGRIGQLQQQMAGLAADRKRLAAPLLDNLRREQQALAILEDEYRGIWEAHPIARKSPTTDIYRDLLTRYATKEARKLAVRGLEKAYRFVLGVEPLDTKAGVRLPMMRKQEDALKAQLSDNRRQRETLVNDHPLRIYVDPWLRRDLEDLDRDYESLKAQATGAAARRAMLEQLPGIETILRTEAEARKAYDEVARETATRLARIAEIRSRLDGSAVRWVRDKVVASTVNVIWSAVLIFLAIVLTPYAIRAAFYYLLAPAAARRPPIRISTADSGQLVSCGDPVEPVVPESGVSVAVTLRPGEALIARSDFVQSAAISARRTTRWLLDWRHTLSSLAAGLWSLEQIEGNGTTVVVSSVKDPLAELALIELPAGSAMVFKPRCLVGMVCPANRPPLITSEWRVWSLHAWLTLQFRYLVFHGPVGLLAKGCRGVRIERAAGGRAIRQDATLGFSAGLHYANARSGPFIPYLKGERGLFEDRFSGEAGYFVYEEVPRSDRATGVSGRGLEGFADAALKVFGL